MFHLKNKIISKIVIFTVIVMVVLWLIPAGTVFGEEGTGTPDTTSPVITLLGDNPVTVEVDSTYTDAGATASDEVDGDLTDSIEVVDSVDTSTVGSYDVTYNVSDAAGNAADEVVRAVEVVEASQGTDETDTSDTGDQEATDTTSPVITLLGGNPVTVEVDSTYTDAGATASDEVDGDLTDSIEVVDNVDTSTVGSYDITYNVSDAAGNAADEVVRAVEVIEVTEVATSVFLNPVISTDKDDYGPEETVIITGTGFASNTIYEIVVVRPDGSIVIGDGSFTPGSDSILTNASGAFTYNYILDGVLGVYTVNAVDESGAVVATTTFTDCDLYINITKYWENNGTSGKQDDEPIITEVATFALYKQGDSNPKISVNTVGGVAQFHITGTYWGTGSYKIVETVAPVGYTGGYDSGWFDVIPGNDIGTWNWDAPNTAIRANIAIPKTVEGMTTEAFAATFALYDGATLVADPDIQSANPMSIANAGQAITFTGVVPGIYTLKETVWPTGYNKMADITVNIDLTGVVTTTPTTLPSPLDTKVRGTVILTKTFEGTATEVGFYLKSGSTYYNTDGTTAADKDLSRQALSSNGTITWSNLPWGDYEIEEDTDSGYTQTLSPSSFTINGDTPDMTVNVGANNRELGSIEIFKTDAFSGLPLGTSTFQLFKIGSLIQIGGDIVLGSDGYYKWSGLEWGDYIVRELFAPTGYLLAPDVPLTIGSEQRHYTLKGEIADPRIPSQLRLIKTDSVTGLPVAGATYNIFSGALLVEKVTTGADGTAAVTLVNWGTYTVQEAAPEPAGYSLDPTVYTVTFDATHTSVTLNVKDTPTGGGGGTLTVAGLTEGIQVLAFTGIDPIIPIAGGSAVIAGLAMLLATLRRRVSRK